MEHETKLLLLAQLPLFLGLLIASFSGFVLKGKSETPKWFLILTWSTAYIFIGVWFVGWMFGLFSSFFGITGKVAWGYFAAGMLLQNVARGSPGTVFSREAKKC